MNFTSYLNFFGEIINSPNPAAPYDNPDYLEYTRLNYSRFRRWLKTGVLTPETQRLLKGITAPQTWIVITEPWCGDAAHSLPFIELMAKENPLITTVYELRDSEPHRIEGYLTGGGKAIPKLIIQQSQGQDLGVWGARPEACQALYLEAVKQGESADVIKEKIQRWYNADKGVSIQQEICALVSEAVEKVDLA